MLSPSPQTLAQYADALRAGDLIGLPTETVYGLAGDATNNMAIARIYETKGRPHFNPLIIHCADVAMAEQYGVFDDKARLAASVFWPGPLTIIVPLQPQHGLSALALAGLTTVALRVPAHPIAQQVIAELGRPLAAPSANKSGSLSPTAPHHVMSQFKDDAQPRFIVAGGRCSAGLESTIVMMPECVMLRPGVITVDDLAAVLGPVTVSTGDANAPSAPGQTLRHYAPRKPIRLEATDIKPGEAFLGFGPDLMLARQAAFSLNLSPHGDMHEAASNLFAYLHALDADPQTSGIAVAPIPINGLGFAINERLARAAEK